MSVTWELWGSGTAASSAYLRLHFYEAPRAAPPSIGAASRRSVMETLVERCAGLDVHKDTVVACVRLLEGRTAEPPAA